MENEQLLRKGTHSFTRTIQLSSGFCTTGSYPLVCNVADFYHVTFSFRRADFYYEIPSIGSQEESPHLSIQVHSYYCIICLFLFVILFHAIENYVASTCAVSYCNDFRISRCTSVGLQLPSFHRQLSRHCHDAAFNIS